MSSTPEPADPATPATAPLLGPDGALLYTGSDGRRYIVCAEPSQAGDPQLIEAFDTLRAGAAELDEVVEISRGWIEMAIQRGMSRQQAVRLLLDRLGRALGGGTQSEEP
jgi:hypothetical protein